MAVTLNCAGITIHHRNPSGFKNKVRWLLAASRRKESEMRRIYKNIHMNDLTSTHSWKAAMIVATAMISANMPDVLNYLDSIIWCSDAKTWYEKICLKIGE